MCVCTCIRRQGPTMKAILWIYVVFLSLTDRYDMLRKPRFKRLFVKFGGQASNWQSRWFSAKDFDQQNNFSCQSAGKLQTHIRVISSGLCWKAKSKGFQTGAHPNQAEPVALPKELVVKNQGLRKTKSHTTCDFWSGNPSAWSILLTVNQIRRSSKTSGKVSSFEIHQESVLGS